MVSSAGEVLGRPCLFLIDSWSGFIDHGISEDYKLRSERKLVGCRAKFKGTIHISVVSHTCFYKLWGKKKACSGLYSESTPAAALRFDFLQNSRLRPCFNNSLYQIGTCNRSNQMRLCLLRLPKAAALKDHSVTAVTLWAWKS